MDHGREVRVVEIVEMAGKTRGQRGKVDIDPLGAARHGRNLRDAEIAGSGEDGVDARMQRRADRRPNHIDERTPRLPSNLGGQRTLRERMKALRKCGGDKTH